VERRSGKYFGAGTALRQISLVTGGTLTLKRSGKSRRTRYVDPRSVYLLAQKCPRTRELASKISTIFPRVAPSAGGGDPLPHSPPARLHSVRGGASSHGCWDPSSRKPFPQIKIYHYTAATDTRASCRENTHALRTSASDAYLARPSVQ